MAKRIPTGKVLNFALHYQTTGQPEKDRTRMGIWFSKGPVTHEVFTNTVGSALPTDRLKQNRYFVNGEEVRYVPGPGGGQGPGSTVPPIPPYADNFEMRTVTPVTEAITVFAFHPHMHLRGKDMKYIVTYPDGKEETVLNVYKYDFNWQLQYELETPLRLPAGAKITAISHFDNSLKNKYNPAPDQEVYWSEQSWDEMHGAFYEFAIDSRDLRTQKSTTQQQP